MSLKLEEKFDYDPVSGHFTWKFTNSQHVQGQRAGFLGAWGYWTLYHEGKHMKAHRVAWYLTHGEWPSMIDHIDGDRTNNSLSNLRIASYSQQNCNRRKPRNNSSGVKGVSWNSQAEKWQARVQADKRVKFLGYFESVEEASAAVLTYRETVHKEFARHE